MSHVKNTTAGFSLLELMIYLALFGMLMSGVLVTVFAIIKSNEANIASVGVQEEGTFINRKLSWAVSGATSVTLISPTSISVVRPDLGAQSPLVISESDTEITISRGGASPVPLSTSRYKVSNTNFTVMPTAGGVPTSVKVTYNIEDAPFIYKTYLRI